VVRTAVYSHFKRRGLSKRISLVFPNDRGPVVCEEVDACPEPLRNFSLELPVGSVGRKSGRVLVLQ
jgi:hypothetical protein